MPKTNGHTTSATNGSASKSSTKSRVKKAAPTREAIQIRAYEIYLERHGAPGNPLEDWVRAETELLRTATNGKSSGSVAAKSI